MSDKLQDSLREHRANVVTVVLINGEERRTIKVAKPGSRNAPQLTVKLVGKAGAWLTAELVDKDGGVLDIIPNEGAAGDVEELGKVQRSQRDRDLDLILRAQEKVLQYRDKETRDMLAAMPAALTALSTALTQVAKVYQQGMAAAYEVGQLQGEVAASGDDGPPVAPASSGIVDKLLPLVLARLAAPPPVPEKK